MSNSNEKQTPVAADDGQQGHSHQQSIDGCDQRNPEEIMLFYDELLKEIKKSSSWTAEDWQRARIEAEQQGRLYQLFIDGCDYHNPEEGELFGADSLEEAKESAHWRAWRNSCDMDNRDTLRDLRYPTHGYQLYHKGVLIVDYKPPTPEEVAEGKVQLV